MITEWSRHDHELGDGKYNVKVFDEERKLPANKLTPEQWKRLMDVLGIEKVDLVANDSGGAIAQIFAAHHQRTSDWENLRRFASVRRYFFHRF